MRFAFVPFVVLAASFSLVAAQTATVPPDVAPNKIDMSKPPAPPSNVNVLNFPEVQAVEGTVAVSNLPAVQTVGGTVNVGNLPLDADGAVRVTSAPARQMVWYELIGEPVTDYSAVLSVPENVDGFSRVGVLVQTTYADRVSVDLYSRWAADEGFFAVADSRIGSDANGAIPCSGRASTRLICPASGGELQVHVNSTYGYLITITSVRVYLFP